ncbi:MAG: glycerophosphodiester phosphodiesterase family protein [Verrucomicrobia bacterium]|jgi:glycerophosphoryl diester phosphodiesterase|nr:glycerophosphodiester phosphodiesterase family protein [Verrucomicrobiota bacterium]MDA7667765.1 glycerophosphodiester phosphodiesterase family protein [bacterium]MDB4745680.1 glycerophosphodiester phosphodiesterase family protein [Verrucomicrobiota bacterium]
MARHQNLQTLIAALACTLFVVSADQGENQEPEPVSSNVARTMKAIRSPNSSAVLVAAHRGGYEQDKVDFAPENSIENILNCHRRGYDLYETDIQRSKDGHFVIIHDKTIDRETNGVGEVRDMTLTELKHLRKRFRDGSLSSARIATFEEFLIHGKGHTVFKADLKPGLSAHFKELIELVKKLDAFDTVIFRVPYNAVSLFAQHRADGLTWPRSTVMFRVKDRKQLDNVIETFNPSVIHIDVSRTNPASEETLELIRYARSRSLHVQTHAEGQRDDWTKLINAGVRMFHTSAPAKLSQFCRKLSDPRTQ